MKKQNTLGLFRKKIFDKIFCKYEIKYHKMVIHIFLMVLHHSQDVFQIAEWSHVIRFRCFCDAVDDRTGFRAIDTVEQFPCMFVQTVLCMIM